MKAFSFAVFTIFLAIVSVVGDQERYVTVTMTTSYFPTNRSLPYYAGTNSITIAEGETGELINVEPSVGTLAVAAYVTKGDVSVEARPASLLIPGTIGATPRGTTVAGPATFVIYRDNISTPGSGLMTVKISPMTFSPQQAVTVAPGMGNVQITMESSTNLVTWTDATNGVYSDSLKFFRIKLTKLTP